VSPRPPGVLTIFWRVGVQLARGNAFGIAAQIAYNFLFALFPFLITLVSLAAYLPIHGLLRHFLEAVQPLLPAAAYKLVEHQLSSTLESHHGGLLTLGLALSVWSASSAVSALIAGLNDAYHVQETRPFWRTRGLALILTVGGGVGMLAILVVVILGGRIGHWLSNAFGKPVLYSAVWSLLRWPVTAVIVMVGLAFLYHLGPNVKRPFRLVTPGTLAGTFLWLASTIGFSFYVNSWANYSVMYGSLAAVVVLLTGFYMTGLALILGGQIDAVIEGRAPARARR
jgi:membrane protein